MHAHHVVEFIGPPGLRWVEVPEPDTTAQLVVEVMAAGVSFADLLYTRGRYQVRPTLPFAPGMDAAGVVRSAPPGSGFEAGQRVAVLAAYGCWQEVITADPSWTLPLPDDMGFEAGAAAPLNYLTSLFALVRRGQAQPGEVLLVHGAAGGVGRPRSRWGVRSGSRPLRSPPMSASVPSPRAAVRTMRCAAPTGGRR